MTRPTAKERAGLVLDVFAASCLVLDPIDAQYLLGALTEAMTDAWDEGYRRGYTEGFYAGEPVDEYTVRPPLEKETNPYRSKS